MTQSIGTDVSHTMRSSAAKFIVDKAVNVARPRATVPPCRDLDHLPGEGGLIAGYKNMASWMLRGNAHLIEQRQRFGSVYRHAFGRMPIVCVSDPELLASITKNDRQEWSTALAWASLFHGIDPTREVIDSPGTLDFEPHRDARRLLQPAFGMTAIASYVDMASEAYERAINAWIARRTIAFKPEVRSLFAHVSGRVFIGVSDEAEGVMLDKALGDSWRGPMALIRHPLLSPTWRKALRGHRVLRETLRARVPERRAGKGTDLFSRLCQTARDVDWLDDDVLVRLFIGVLSGAFDTASSAAASLAFLLAKHQDWQDRLRAESKRVANGRLSLEQSKELEEYDWVIKEALRLYPPASFLPRQALCDVDLAGKRVPAGTMVFALIAPVLRDPTWWRAPDRFDPERFAPARAEDKQTRGLYLPFGAGAHTCIGSQLALFELKAFWHALLSRCRLRLVNARYTAKHQISPIGVVAGNVEVTLEPL
jgi:cytochrome P450